VHKHSHARHGGIDVTTDGRDCGRHADVGVGVGVGVGGAIASDLNGIRIEV
jgi:hypothetical protein